MGYGDVGVFWQKRARRKPALKTANIDRMAAEGMRLMQHYSDVAGLRSVARFAHDGPHQGHARSGDNQFDKPCRRTTRWAQ